MNKLPIDCTVCVITEESLGYESYWGPVRKLPVTAQCASSLGKAWGMSPTGGLWGSYQWLHSVRHHWGKPGIWVPLGACEEVTIGCSVCVITGESHGYESYWGPVRKLPLAAQCASSLGKAWGMSPTGGLWGSYHWLLSVHHHWGKPGVWVLLGACEEVTIGCSVCVITGESHGYESCWGPVRKLPLAAQCVSSLGKAWGMSPTGGLWGSYQWLLSVRHHWGKPGVWVLLGACEEVTSDCSVCVITGESHGYESCWGSVRKLPLTAQCASSLGKAWGMSPTGGLWGSYQWLHSVRHHWGKPGVWVLLGACEEVTSDCSVCVITGESLGYESYWGSVRKLPLAAQCASSLGKAMGMSPAGGLWGSYHWLLSVRHHWGKPGIWVPLGACEEVTIGCSVCVITGESHGYESYWGPVRKLPLAAQCASSLGKAWGMSPTGGLWGSYHWLLSVHHHWGKPGVWVLLGACEEVTIGCSVCVITGESHGYESCWGPVRKLPLAAQCVSSLGKAWGMSPTGGLWGSYQWLLSVRHHWGKPGVWVLLGACEEVTIGCSVCVITGESHGYESCWGSVRKLPLTAQCASSLGKAWGMSPTGGLWGSYQWLHSVRHHWGKPGVWVLLGACEEVTSDCSVCVITGESLGYESYWGSVRKLPLAAQCASSLGKAMGMSPAGGLWGSYHWLLSVRHHWGKPGVWVLLGACEEVTSDCTVCVITGESLGYESYWGSVRKLPLAAQCASSLGKAWGMSPTGGLWGSYQWLLSVRHHWGKPGVWVLLGACEEVTSDCTVCVITGESLGYESYWGSVRKLPLAAQCASSLGKAWGMSPTGGMSGSYQWLLSVCHHWGKPGVWVLLGVCQDVTSDCSVCVITGESLGYESYWGSVRMLPVTAQCASSLGKAWGMSPTGGLWGSYQWLLSVRHHWGKPGVWVPLGACEEVTSDCSVCVITGESLGYESYWGSVRKLPVTAQCASSLGKAMGMSPAGGLWGSYQWLHSVRHHWGKPGVWVLLGVCEEVTSDCTVCVITEESLGYESYWGSVRKLPLTAQCASSLGKAWGMSPTGGLWGSYHWLLSVRHHWGKPGVWVLLGACEEVTIGCSVCVITGESLGYESYWGPVRKLPVTAQCASSLGKAWGMSPTGGLWVCYQWLLSVRHHWRKPGVWVLLGACEEVTSDCSVCVITGESLGYESYWGHVRKLPVTAQCVSSLGKAWGMSPTGGLSGCYQWLLSVRHHWGKPGVWVLLGVCEEVTIGCSVCVITGESHGYESCWGSVRKLPVTAQCASSLGKAWGMSPAGGLWGSYHWLLSVRHHWGRPGVWVLLGVCEEVTSDCSVCVITGESLGYESYWGPVRKLPVTAQCASSLGKAWGMSPTGGLWGSYQWLHSVRHHWGKPWVWVLLGVCEEVTSDCSVCVITGESLGYESCWGPVRKLPLAAQCASSLGKVWGMSPTGGLWGSYQWLHSVRHHWGKPGVWVLLGVCEEVTIGCSVCVITGESHGYESCWGSVRKLPVTAQCASSLGKAWGMSPAGGLWGSYHWLLSVRHHWGRPGVWVLLGVCEEVTSDCSVCVITGESLGYESYWGSVRKLPVTAQCVSSLGKA